MRPQVRFSLRNRVALTALVVLTAWVLVLTVVINALVSSRLQAEADGVLRARAQAAASTVDVSAGGQVSIRDTRDDAALDVGTWIFEGGQVLERSGTSRRLDEMAAQLTGRGQLFRELTDSDVRWYAEPIMYGDRQVATVVASLSLAPYRTTQEAALAGTVALAALMLGGVYLALRAGVGRALRPVAQMTHQAAHWSAHDLDRRFGEDRRPVELDDLAATLDGVLNRLSSVVRHEKQLSAEISHELRTPLARILAEVELLRRTQPPADTDAVLASVQTSVVEMSEMLETLMAAARSDSSSPPGRCDAVDVMRALIDRRTEPDVVVHLHSRGVVMAGVEGNLLGRALSPLLDNAVRYARTAVDITVAADRGLVRIEVRDDGPGFAEEDLPHVFEPGRRSSRPDAHEGAGLGLALARRLVRSADGSVQATNGARGAVLAVTVPLA